MIVVDTNVIAYLLLPSDRAPQARSVFLRDSSWIAPILWRSEFRSILAQYLRAESIRMADALDLYRLAERLLAGAEYEVNPEQVLRLVDETRCSAYDCEFIALARDLGVPLVTTDKRILREVPETALSMEDFTR